MSRRASKVDANQRDLVEALRRSGVSVQLLHTQGGGCPDLLCGYRGHNYLLEVKDGSLPPSARKLRGPQPEWHASWRGQVAVVCSYDEAMGVITGAAPE